MCHVMDMGADMASRAYVPGPKGSGTARDVPTSRPGTARFSRDFGVPVPCRAVPKNPGPGTAREINDGHGTARHGTRKLHALDM